jgi:signal transduction histidine kinase
VRRSPTSLPFAVTLAFALALVIWWTLFQLRESRALEAAATELARSDGVAAAQALGAGSPAELAELARRRWTMFLSEGITFAALLLLGGLLFAAMQRRELRIRRNHDQFLAGTTHELKTPLATLRLLLESLQAGRLPPDKLDRYLRSGLLEADRLERGLTNVLTAAGLRTAPRPLRREPGDLAADVRSALAAIAPRAEAAGVGLQTGELAATPLQRDPDAVQLILHNLLDNAVKYSPPGATVRVEVRRQPETAELRVVDEGRGMDADELAHAFEPFFRGRDHRGGSGLGLHLVRQLVEAHGGSVEAHSEGRDRGAELRLRLPCGRNGA